MKKIIFIILLIIFGGLLAVGYFAADVFLAGPETGSEKIFTVRSGDGVNQISHNLYEQNLIGNKFNFETYVWLLRREGSIKAGDYRLSSQMSLRQLTNILTYGWGTNERKVTLIEGLNNRQIAEKLAEVFAPENKQKFIEDFNAAAKQDYSYSILLSKPSGIDVEGYLFPDTYNFFITATPVEMISAMIKNLDQKLTDQMRADIASQGKTIHEVLTLASIIEREVSTEQDRRLVADLFWRRLDVGMALQADSTVNYITGKKTPAVSLTDLQTDSLYNTYKYPGLPPGPIASPSLESIMAAIYPLANDYWFFLTTDEGQVIYSKNLAGHNIAKQQHLK